MGEIIVTKLVDASKNSVRAAMLVLDRIVDGECVDGLVVSCSWRGK
jgi:hypothetical protein